MKPSPCEKCPSDDKQCPGCKEFQEWFIASFNELKIRLRGKQK